MICVKKGKIAKRFSEREHTHTRRSHFFIQENDYHKIDQLPMSSLVKSPASSSIATFVFIKKEQYKHNGVRTITRMCRILQVRTDGEHRQPYLGHQKVSLVDFYSHLYILSF